MEPIAIVIAAVVALLYAAAIAFAIVQIVRTPTLSHAEKWAWCLVLVVFPFIGSIVWFLAGPHPFGLHLGKPAPDPIPFKPLVTPT